MVTSDTARASGAAGTIDGARRVDRAHAWPPALVGLGVAGAVVYVALVDPHQPGHYLVCPWLALTGQYCAGCGGLRATYDLAHGDLAGAWGMNPLWVVTAPLLVVLWGAWLRRSWTASAPPDPGQALRMVAPWLVLAVVVAFTVLRNVPALAPWLAP